MNNLQCQDEILQMMYWMRGEKVGETVSSEQLNRFLQIDAAALENALRSLIARGLVAETPSGFTLTGEGIMEGGRRFLDEFSTMLGKEDHLSCADPGCDCQSPGFDGLCRSVGVHR